MKIICSVFLLSICLSAIAQQTYPISGQVTDEDGKNIAGATVFITNSTFITSTDNAGKFNLVHIIPRTYELVVRFIGFTPDIQTITLTDKPVKVAIRLKESNTTIKEVVINGSNANRAKYMDWFVKNFIGQTDNAAQCKILNPEVIQFAYDKKTGILKAYADELLIIENKGLGYKIKYLLTRFEYNAIKNLYNGGGSAYFEEMKGTIGQQKRWNKNREEVYWGSRTYFFKVMRNKTADVKGFIMYNMEASGKNGFAVMQQVNIDSVFNSNAITGDSSRLKRYIINFRGRQVGSFFETPAKGFVTGGSWSMKRIADLTPVDYFVEPPPLASPKK